MKFLCSVPYCPYKIGSKSKLYSLPNPVKNKALFDKWVQSIGAGLDNLEDLFVYNNRFVCEEHFQNLCLKNTSPLMNQLSAINGNEELKVVNANDTKGESIEFEKSTVKDPKVVHATSRPIYVLQKIDGKEKPALLILQRTNRTSKENIRDEIQLTTDIKVEDPPECPQADQEVIINTSETIDINKSNNINIKKLQYKNIQNNSPQRQEAIDLSETHNSNTKKLDDKVIQKDSPCEVVNAIETIDLTTSQGTHIMKIKCKRISKSVSERIWFSPEKGKPRILKHSTGQAGPAKPPENIIVDSKTDSVKAKPMILKQGKGLVINLESVKSTAVKQSVNNALATKRTQERQLTLVPDVLSNTIKVKSQIKRIENQLVQHTSNDSNLVTNIEGEAIVLADIDKVVSEVDISNINITEVEGSEVNIALAKHSEVEVSEVEVPHIEECLEVSEVELNATSGVAVKPAIVSMEDPLRVMKMNKGYKESKVIDSAVKPVELRTFTVVKPKVKYKATPEAAIEPLLVTTDDQSIEAQATLEHNQVSTDPSASAEQMKVVKTYLKKSRSSSAANSSRLARSPVKKLQENFALPTGYVAVSGTKCSPVAIPQETPIPNDEWRSLVSGLVAPAAVKLPVKRNVAMPVAEKLPDMLVVTVPVCCNPVIPAAKNPVKQGVFRVTTEAMHTRLSQTAVPLFTGQVDRWYMDPDEFNKFIETIKNRPIVQKKLSETIDAANLHKLPHSEAVRMKNLIKSYHEQSEKLKDMIHSLEKQLKRAKLTIAALKKRISGTKVNSKSKAFEKITSDMTEDAKMIVRMQVVHHKKKPQARRFNLKEKLFSLALYKLSRQAYRYMSGILAMPTTTTLNKFLNKLHTQLLVNDGAATHNNLQEKDELLAAVAAITAESLTENFNADVVTENRGSGTNNEPIEYSTSQVAYPNIECYTDADYVQTDCTNFNSYLNEIVYTTQYIDQTVDQTPKVIEIPSSYGTISVGYEGTQEHHQYTLPEDTGNLSYTKENITKNIKIPTASNQPAKKSKIFVPGMTDEKKEKIDFVLSKMMTPEQLKNLVNIPRKKVVKKVNNEVKKRIKKPIVESGVTGITKSNQKIKKDNNVSKIMKPKMNLKKVTPSSVANAETNTSFMDQSLMPQALQSKPVITDRYEISMQGTITKRNINVIQSIPSPVHHAQTNTIFIDHSYMPESISGSDRIITNRYNSEIDVLGAIRTHTSNLQQNLPSSVHYEHANVDIMDHIPERPLSSVQVITNKDNSEINAMDTVTKLRRNLEKYSPEAIQNKTNISEESYMFQRTSGSERIISNIDNRKLNTKNTVKRRNISHSEKESIITKRKNKSAMDESQLSRDPPKKYSSPEMFILGTRDVRPANLGLSRNINISQPENNASDVASEPTSVKGFDMPDLNQDFNTTFDNSNRNKFGFKRLPTKPY